MKVHLHEEQFDGWWHAACYRLDAPPESKRIVCDDDFEKLPASQRCRLCARINWPHGGEDNHTTFTPRG